MVKGETTTTNYSNSHKRNWPTDRLHDCSNNTEKYNNKNYNNNSNNHKSQEQQKITKTKKNSQHNKKTQKQQMSQQQFFKVSKRTNNKVYHLKWLCSTQCCTCTHHTIDTHYYWYKYLCWSSYYTLNSRDLLSQSFCGDWL